MSDPSPLRRFIGGLLMAVGGLIAGLCGLCTGGFELASIHDLFSNTAQGPDNISIPVFVPLAVGIVPILIGVGLLFWGRHLMRPSP
jgi:hypothetical protein